MKLIEVYKCLCDETRLRILHLLSHQPLCVCHFQEILDGIRHLFRRLRRRVIPAVRRA